MPEITGQEDVPLPLNGGAALAANVHRSSGAERLAEPADSLVRPVTKRWTEQRWILDNIIQANGVDWDQPRTHCWNAACGLQAAPDFARIRRRMHKYADLAPEFADMARIREERARLAQAAGELVTARECYFMAAIRWGAAQWPMTSTGNTIRTSAIASRATAAWPTITWSQSGSPGAQHGRQIWAILVLVSTCSLASATVVRSTHRDTLQALPGSDRAIAVAGELVRGLGLEPT